MRVATLRRLVLLSVLAALATAPAAQADELIVRRDAGLSAAERADVRAAAGVAIERRLQLADTESSRSRDRRAEALAELRSYPDVRWASATARSRPPQRPARIRSGRACGG